MRFVPGYHATNPLHLIQGSPSPLVGMSYGVTFLNPVCGEWKHGTQHTALSRIGFPYSYVVDLDNKTISHLHTELNLL